MTNLRSIWLGRVTLTASRLPATPPALSLPCEASTKGTAPHEIEASPLGHIILRCPAGRVGGGLPCKDLVSSSRPLTAERRGIPEGFCRRWHSVESDSNYNAAVADGIL